MVSALHPSRLLHRPPLWREGGRTGIELAGLLRDPIYRGAGVPAGDGRPVLLIPGFLAGDNSLGMLTQWLRRAGYRTSSAGMRSHVDCSSGTAERVERRLERLVARQGARAVVIGQSRGGMLARVLGVRRPDLVDGVVALGSPQLDMFSVHPLVLLQIGIVGVLGTLRVPGLFGAGCLRGSCCAGFRADLEAPMPTDVDYVTIYSRSDGIVDWRACLDPDARQVEVTASHCGMAVSAAVYREIAGALRRVDPTPDDVSLAA